MGDNPPRIPINIAGFCENRTPPSWGWVPTKMVLRPILSSNCWDPKGNIPIAVRTYPLVMTNSLLLKMAHRNSGFSLINSMVDLSIAKC